MKIHSIQDGDTLTVEWKPDIALLYRLRLADIDAPERGEPLWRESKLALATFAQTGPLRIEHTIRQETKPDPINRLVAYIWIGDVLVQQMLIDAGLAVVWCPRGPNQHTTHLIGREQIARHLRLGVWTMPAHRLCDIYNHNRRRPF